MHACKWLKGAIVGFLLKVLPKPKANLTLKFTPKFPPRESPSPSFPDLNRFQMKQNSWLSTSLFQLQCLALMKRKLFSLSQSCTRRIQQGHCFDVIGHLIWLSIASLCAVPLSSTHRSVESPQFSMTALHTSSLFATAASWIVAFIYSVPFSFRSIEKWLHGVVFCPAVIAAFL